MRKLLIATTVLGFAASSTVAETQMRANDIRQEMVASQGATTSFSPDVLMGLYIILLLLMANQFSKGGAAPLPV